MSISIDLSGKSALVTASSQGMGFACAEIFVKAGANVLICARNEDNLSSANQRLNEIRPGSCTSVVADVSKLDDVNNVLSVANDTFESIDILVNNAGGPKPGKIETLSDQDWFDAINLNLMSTVRFSTAVLPKMKENAWGRIINITSILAKAPGAGMGLSNSLRAGVLGFAKTLSREVAEYGITVNSLCPGAVETERFNRLAELDAKEEGKTVEEVKLECKEGIPVKFIAQPTDFANCALFFASKESAYVTGTVLQVDGGEYKGII